MLTRARLVTVLVIAGLLGGTLAAQTSQERPQDQARKDRLNLDLYFEMETVSEPQISPDGSQIIYTRGWIDKVNDRRESSLWIMNADGSRNRFLTKGSGARWSPSGDRIAYTSQGEPKGTQIFVRWMDAEGVAHQGLSSHRSEQFGTDYGVLLKEWRMLQRAVFVIGRDDRLVHAEYVPDQMAEPDYDAAVAASNQAAE